MLVSITFGPRACVLSAASLQSNGEKDMENMNGEKTVVFFSTNLVETQI